MGTSRHHGSAEDNGKVRVRFLEVEIEGSNATLLDGIRHITMAIPSNRVIVRQSLPADTGRPQTQEPSADDEAVASAVQERQPETEDPQVEQSSSESVSKRQRSTVRPAKPPQLATDLNIDGVPMPFKEFCETTKIDKDSAISDKVIVVATWLKEHRGDRQMGGSEFYTCCKVMDWSTPADPTAAMRALKRDNKLMGGASAGRFALSLLGEKHFRELRK